MQHLQPLKNLFERYKKFMLSAQQFILLHFVYVLGIGLTAIAAKVVGKHFVTNQVPGSAWVAHNQKGDSTRMF